MWQTSMKQKSYFVVTPPDTWCLAVAVVLFSCISANMLLAADTPQIVVKLSDTPEVRKVANEPITGRIYVLLTKKPLGSPMRGPDWFHPEPFFGMDVTKF